MQPIIGDDDEEKFDQGSYRENLIEGTSEERTLQFSRTLSMALSDQANQINAIKIKME